MSEIKVNSIKGVSASSAALTIHNTDGSVTIPTPDIPDKSNYNLLINGQFDIWQRGTDSGSNTTDGILGADRWMLASSGATKQVTRQAFAVGQTDVPSNPKYYLRFAVTTGNNNCALRQRIEDVDKVQGPVTLSFWAKGTNPAGGNFTIINRQNFGTGGSASSVVDTGVSDFTVTTSWAKKTFTFTPPSISGKTLGTNNNSYYELEVFRQPAADTGTAAYTIDIANVKLEYGSYATDYQRINEGQELSLCQRYYEQYDHNNTYWLCSGVYNASTEAIFPFDYQTEKRDIPAITMQASVNTILMRPNTSNAEGGTLSALNIKTRKCAFKSTSNPSSSSGGYATTMSIYNSGSGSTVLSIDAEL